MIRKNNLKLFIAGILAAGIVLSSCATTNPKQKFQVDHVGPLDEQYYAELNYCKDQIEKMTDFKPQIVLVLGSGLNDYAERFDIIEKIPYEDIDGWPVSTVEG
ncbi:MAG: hypothetical protein J6D36_01075, partial [Erysipelotrichaceae bacterium]|nr:hypothetical protein [Erysipelotrichaceae bacterium]